ncbi:phospholipid/cholesterol/gamma-HCH transport system permease protein [Haloechinothrix alba]|uniref:Phospholipid/cholesterol/gamma-HCH transport system permease protein n=1 Tax=Haloechinothrix alba TaxID=664784 RepID=A0A238ZLB8_9PSEU|nr:ABC transporter permease [Haloechinothrix alba]SNR84246.1 phospholipid/cholesterol/gamma-HCH transport system permease protein [Haloechinothrix alba]
MSAPADTDMEEDGDGTGSASPGKPKRAAGGRIGEPLVELGAMARLGIRVLWMAVRRPWGYWRDAFDQMFLVLKQCWIPMAISTTAFGLGAPGLQGGNIYDLFGMPERLGSFFIMASIREFAPWVNAMVVAGVVGTAITADLGARRIRDEIDAMEVLGVDPIRTLVLPRVVALTLLTGLLGVVALCFGLLGGFIASVPLLGANPWAFYESLFANLTLPDVWGSLTKMTIFGLIIGVVHCYMGMYAKGGPIGVGRAVNQSVVISFAVIWVFNVVFTNILLGLHPEIQVYK